jgi:hypothetical protein
MKKLVKEKIQMSYEKHICQNMILNNVIQSKLNKAEALAVAATLIDFTAIDNEILENYIETLCDLIQETKSLYRKIPPF